MFPFDEFPGLLVLDVNDNTLGAKFVSHGPCLDPMPMTTLPGLRSRVSRLGILRDYDVLVFELVLWPGLTAERM